jgi:hypothetical protein
MPNVAGLVTSFERKKFDRVVMSGHGAWWPTDGSIPVPKGITIYFYVRHGDLTANAIGMAVENRFSSSAPPTPVDTYTEGQQVYNYRLSFGSRLDLQGSLNTYKFDWITVDQVDRQIPLSVLLKDLRCAPPCEIHWAACREIKTDTIGKNDKYITRNNLSTVGKDLNLVDSSGTTSTHNVKMPGKIAIPVAFR